MRLPSRFVELTPPEQQQLEHHWRHGKSSRVRQRAQALLLSHRSYSVKEIAGVLEVHRDTVVSWFQAWEEHGEAGLSDGERCGAPPKLTPEEQARAVELLKEHPHQPKQVLAQLKKETGKTIGSRTLSRIARRADLRWKRMRRSTNNKPDEQELGQAKKVVNNLWSLHERQRIDLWFYDEAGFTCEPSVPYGWQPIGETKAIPSMRSPRLNTLGFLSADQKFGGFLQQGTVISEDVIDAFDMLSHQIENTTVVVLDRASIHTSRAFRLQLALWQKRGLYVYYLPPYSPELNWIENLWRLVKYHWLPLDVYESFPKLRKGVRDVLANIGTSLTINSELSPTTAI